MTKRRHGKEKQVSKDEVHTAVHSGTARRPGCSETSDWKVAGMGELERKLMQSTVAAPLHLAEGTEENTN